MWLLIIGIFAIYFIGWCVDKYKEIKLDYNRKVNNLLQRQMDLSEKEADLENKKKDFEKLINDTSQTCTWLANRVADFKKTQDSSMEEYLVNKSHPALKASEVVSIIKKEKRELLRENKMLKYQLDFLTDTFPFINDAMQLSVTELSKATKDLYNDEEAVNEYDTLKEYISPEEYQKLSNVEKYQLALDRYLNKRKRSLWEIGISYERYIGYKYEMKKYIVTYNGALEGFEDLGRDLIAENDKEIIVIQCKYWKKESVIHENVVFQLYGTMKLKELELKKHNITNKLVKGFLITTTTLSDTAKEIAKCLNIKVLEQENFIKNYPCIKCNINKSTNEKIYHLPFDQQYDRIHISIEKGEFYVNTVQEAEKLGFRRAKKYLFNK